MSHAERCPICGGSGKVHNPNSGGMEDTKVCHGCGGKGWVTVEDAAPPSIQRPGPGWGDLKTNSKVWRQS